MQLGRRSEARLSCDKPMMYCRMPSQRVRARAAPQHAVRSDFKAHSGCSEAAEPWACQPVAVRSSLDPLGYRHDTQL
jgi:hypothetical protein